MADTGTLPHVIEAILNHISGHKAGVGRLQSRHLRQGKARGARPLGRHVFAITSDDPEIKAGAVR